MNNSQPGHQRKAIAGETLGKPLIDALGLSQHLVRSIKITARVGQIALVEVEVLDIDVDKTVSVFKRFELVEKDDENA